MGRTISKHFWLTDEIKKTQLKVEESDKKSYLVYKIEIMGMCVCVYVRS
jgi:hypothetical protein